MDQFISVLALSIIFIPITTIIIVTLYSPICNAYKKHKTFKEWRVGDDVYMGIDEYGKKLKGRVELINKFSVILKNDEGKFCKKNYIWCENESFKEREEKRKQESLIEQIEIHRLVEGQK